MVDPNPVITFTVTADNLEEAAQFANRPGFMLPELTAEFVLANGDQRDHCFELKAEFLQQIPASL
ncbi:hypothetical protein [Microbacterium sp. NPDC055665]